MTQRAVLPGGGVIVGQRADARHAVAYPRAQLPRAGGALVRGGGEGQGGGAAADGEGRGLAGGGGQQGLHLLGGVHGAAVQRGDDVTLAEAAGAGGGVTLRQFHHQYAVGKELDEMCIRDRGNTCGPRPTSCADQLAIAVQQAYDKEQAGK